LFLIFWLCVFIFFRFSLISLNFRRIWKVSFNWFFIIHKIFIISTKLFLIFFLIQQIFKLTKFLIFLVLILNYNAFLNLISDILIIWILLFKLLFFQNCLLIIFLKFNLNLLILLVSIIILSVWNNILWILILIIFIYLRRIYVTRINFNKILLKTFIWLILYILINLGIILELFILLNIFLNTLRFLQQIVIIFITYLLISFILQILSHSFKRNNVCKIVTSTL